MFLFVIRLLPLFLPVLSTFRLLHLLVRLREPLPVLSTFVLLPPCAKPSKTQKHLKITKPTKTLLLLPFFLLFLLLLRRPFPDLTVSSPLFMVLLMLYHPPPSTPRPRLGEYVPDPSTLSRAHHRGCPSQFSKIPLSTDTLAHISMQHALLGPSKCPKSRPTPRPSFPSLLQLIVHPAWHTLLGPPG